MFQSFDNPSQKALTPERLVKLRAAMQKAAIDIYLVPHGDEHQNEYMPERALRLAWISGFTGSAGFLIITQQEAVLFVDGRYTLQAEAQVDLNHFSLDSLIKHPPAKWLENNIVKDARVGFDPWCITLNERKRFGDAISGKNGKLVACENLVDAIWSDQPAPPLGQVSIHDERFAGKTALEKIKDISTDISSKADYCVLTDPSSICWLFNIRGQDVQHNPVVMAWAILRPNERPLLFLDKRKLAVKENAYLTQLADIEKPENLEKCLAELAARQKIMLDPAKAASALADIVENAGGKVIPERDPIILPRATKNDAELEGTRHAHLRDGVAMVRFLHWLDTTPLGELDEISAAKKLETLRAETAKSMNSELKEISFDTISGIGPNGAIVHYRVNEETNRPFTPDTLYLVDSGGQYEDGTTDITRTVAIGSPPKAAIEDFTLVLKGHIAIATAKFPVGTRGADIDVLARHALWQQGKDYGHGTGHGVGAYLAVHEGPQSISRAGMEEIKPGMIISNEPGYYRTGHYGIRIENLVVANQPREISGGNIPVMDFETITFCPIDRRLIDPALLSASERDWLNNYHAAVFEKLSPLLEPDVCDWLKTATQAL